MTYYHRGPEIQEVAGLVKDFQTRLKRMRNSRKTDPQEREALLQLSRQVLTGLREERPSQVERAQQKRLTQEFQQLLQTFHDLQTPTPAEPASQEVTEQPPEAEQTLIPSLQAVGGYDELVLRKRNSEVQQLEKDLTAVNVLMRDVAKLVGDQGEHLQRADESADRAVEATGNAVAEIRRVRSKQADRTASALSSKMMCVMLAVLIVAAVLILPVVFFIWRENK